VSTRRDPLARREPLAPRAWNRIWAKGGTTDRVVRAVTGERGLAMLSLAALVVVGALIRMWALGGASFALGSDESRYVAAAQNLANGALPDGEAQWFGARAVFLWPVALAFKIAGATDYSAVAWPFIISLVSIVAAYLVAREITGRRQAVVAAGIVAVAPIEVLMATRLRPDAVMPAFVALAIWAAFRTRTSTHTRAWLITSGVLIGAGWSCRETAVLMVPMVVIAAWPALRASWRHIGALVAGLVTIPVIEMVVFAFAGRPLFPITATIGASSVRAPGAGLENGSTFTGLLISEVVHPSSLVFLVLPVVAIAAIVGVLRRMKALVVPAIWLALGFAVLEVSAIISVDAPARFLTLLTIPAALLVAIALDCRLSPLLIPGIAVITVIAIQPRLDGSPTDANVRLVSQVADVMRPLPRAPILAADYVWWAKLNAYLPMGQLPVARVVDPSFLTGAERAAARRLTPLPDIAAYKGGYVVTGPVTPTDGWPDNWKAFARRVEKEVPWKRLTPVARIGGTTVWRWNK